ncbi:YggT family protein [Arthrobacter sp. AZCC_0090]|nr:YggT family protein [Arthrobacter sp. AZCC_0090]
MLFLVTLIVRLVFDLVQMFARQWRPRGAALVAAHVVYSVTDPPLKRIRRLIPPLQLGGVSLDLAFLIVFIVVSIAMGFVYTLA